MGTNNRWMRALASLLAVAVLVVTLGIPVAAQSRSAGWQGEYYGNRHLGGSPWLVRSDAHINFDWGDGAPGPGLPSNDFSVRWTRDVYFEGGDYRFTTVTDDGVRLVVDGILLIDQWQEMPARTHSADMALRTGMHTIRMDYFEGYGRAVAHLSWAKFTAPTPTPTPTPGVQPPALPQPQSPGLVRTTWYGEYYNNMVLSGRTAMTRNDADINFSWGAASPAPAVRADRFSVRWTGQINVANGRYRFSVETDDGIRVWVDDALIIDEWRHGFARHERTIPLSQGAHTVRVEYFEDGGNAVAKVRIEGPFLVAQRGNLITSLPAKATYSWIKVYRLEANGAWTDTNPRGYGPTSSSGSLKIDGLVVDYARYGGYGHPYWVEQYVNGTLTRSVGNFYRGEPQFRIRGDADNYTPW
ncbi:MAG: hypothetical protein GX605_11050 [Chloroflexi bacterium]|nr:hypothetical protein [Chloroflexota bacterium]